jgi:hypothetical protein
LLPWQAWLLASALLLAQVLGLVHRVEHAPGAAQWLQDAAHTAAAVAEFHDGDARADVGTHDQHSAQHTHDLAHHEAGDAECRLVDQLAHGDALCAAPAPAPAPALSPVPVQAGAAQRLAQPLRAAYQARAPPQA